jgi:two-component system, OmpR family, phosphate regulon sensor histidine kinase PhoR
MFRFLRSSNFLTGYVFVAFGWWAYLLWSGNDYRLIVEMKYLQSRHSTSDITQLDEYQIMQESHQRYRRKIISEGLFFVLCLVAGVRLLRRSANKEVQLANQRRNFLLSITHELKTPIAAIRLVLDTFNKRDLSKEQSNLLTTNALREADRLQGLIQDLLMAARVENSWEPLLERQSVGALAKECANSLQLRYPLANFEMAIEPNADWVMADRGGLASVLLNLMENAVKYSPESSLIRIAAQVEQEKVRLTVADQGKGIPASERKVIFERFYRIGNEETRAATGTGLGLYIVQQIAKAHRWTIKISNNQPQGTVFALESIEPAP